MRSVVGPLHFRGMEGTYGRFGTMVRAAMDDPVVRAAHIYEAVVVALIIYLMVMKPF